MEASIAQQPAIRFIGYPCGAGASDDRCKDAPSYLHASGIDAALRDQGIDIKWCDITPPQGETKEAVLASAGKTLYHQVSQAIEDGALPVIFGGDHSMAAFTWSAITDSLNATRQHGLIWLDAHMDAHSFETSETANIHGMPIARLIGKKIKVLSDIGKQEQPLNPHHIHQLGIRSYEAGEQSTVEEAGIHLHYMDAIASDGFAMHFQEALEHVSSLPHFGLSIDLDAFDPTDAPGTGVREGNGLKASEVLPQLQGLAYHPHIRAIEIAEFNPYLDIDNRTVALITRLLLSLFEKKGV